MLLVKTLTFDLSQDDLNTSPIYKLRIHIPPDNHCMIELAEAED